MINAQGCDRKFADPLRQSPINHNSTAMACQCMSGPPRSGNGADRRQTCAFQAGLQILAQIRFAAKQMWDPRDIGHQPIAAITRDYRRVATGPAAQADKGRRFTRKVCGPRCKIGANRAGIGKRHAAVQPACGSGKAHTMQMIGIA